MSWGMIDGSPLMTECVIHDSEEAGFGGQSIMTVGDMGTGKTTLMLRILQRVSHLDSQSISKTEYLAVHKLRIKKEQNLLESGRQYSKAELNSLLPQMPCKEIPETVLYSGREFDYWHNFLEKNIWSEFKNPKPLLLHLPKGEEFHFIVPFQGKLKDLNTEGICKEYQDTKELLGNLQEGAINVWYPPSKYSFSDDILEEPEIRKAGERATGNLNPKLMNFDLIYHCMQYRYQKHLTWFADEIHSIIPGTASDLEWHVLDWFSRSIDPELRRCHISSIGTTHSCSLVDARHMQRATWYIWTGGAAPNKKYSRVLDGAALKCYAGHCIIERKGVKFGQFDYDRLHGQLPKIRVIRGGLEKANIKEA